MSEAQPDQPAKRKLIRGQIDLSKRYDIHCMAGERELVYEDVPFIAIRSIEKPEGTIYAGFVEVEGADGGRFLVPQHQIILLYPRGTRPPRRAVGGNEQGAPNQAL